MRVLEWKKKILFGLFSVKVKRGVASSLEELSQEQLRKIMALRFRAKTKEEARLWCVAILMNYSNLYGLVPIMDSLLSFYDDNGKEKRLIEIITRVFLQDQWRFRENPFPKMGDLEARKKMSQMSAIEFVEMVRRYEQYRKTGEEKALNLLFASLYRKDVGVFDQGVILENSKAFESVDMATKRCVLIWLENEFDLWERILPNLLGSGKKNKKSGGGKGAGFGWFETIKAVPSEHFGTISEREQSNMLKMLMAMEVDVRDDVGKA